MLQVSNNFNTKTQNNPTKKQNSVFISNGLKNDVFVKIHSSRLNPSEKNAITFTSRNHVKLADMPETMVKIISEVRKLTEKGELNQNTTQQLIKKFQDSKLISDKLSILIKPLSFIDRKIFGVGGQVKNFSFFCKLFELNFKDEKRILGQVVSHEMDHLAMCGTEEAKKAHKEAGILYKTSLCAFDDFQTLLFKKLKKMRKYTPEESIPEVTRENLPDFFKCNREELTKIYDNTLSKILKRRSIIVYNKPIRKYQIPVIKSFLHEAINEAHAYTTNSILKSELNYDTGVFSSNIYLALPLLYEDMAKYFSRQLAEIQKGLNNPEGRKFLQQHQNCKIENLKVPDILRAKEKVLKLMNLPTSTVVQESIA